MMKGWLALGVTLGCVQGLVGCCKLGGGGCSLLAVRGVNVAAVTLLLLHLLLLLLLLCLTSCIINLHHRSSCLLSSTSSSSSISG